MAKLPLVCILLIVLVSAAAPVSAAPPGPPLLHTLGDALAECRSTEQAERSTHKLVDQETDLAVVGQIGGSTRAVARWGQYRLVALGPRLIVLNNHATSPQVVGRSQPLPENIYSLLADGQYVYVGGGQNHVFVFDLSNPVVPRLVGKIAVSGSIYDLAKQGTRLYAAADWGGAAILDVTDPVKPKKLSGLLTDRRVRSVAVSGATLYVGSDKGLNVLNVANGADPQPIGALPLAAYLHDIHLAGGIAYAAEGYG